MVSAVGRVMGNARERAKKWHSQPKPRTEVVRSYFGDAPPEKTANRWLLPAARTEGGICEVEDGSTAGDRCRPYEGGLKCPDTGSLFVLL